MSSNPWAQSKLTFWLASLLLPPLGFVLLWKRPGLGVPAKLGGSVIMLLFAVGHLVFVWGLRFELDGSATRPIFVFGSRASHYEQIERDRAAQTGEPPDEPAAAAPAVAPAPPLALATAAPDSPDQDTPAPAAKPVSGYWTDYRGPGRDGRYEQTPILTSWPGGKLPELWRRPIGEGYASFVVAGGVAFTIDQRREQEVVAAYDMDDGRELWTNSWRARFEESMGGPGPRATPTWHNGRVYALGAEGELRSIDAANGETRWRVNILEDNGASNLSWAMAAAPLIVDDAVVTLPGGSRGRSVVAYHKETGRRMWGALDDAQAYTSPMLVHLDGRRQLLVVTKERAVGLVPEDGTVLWEYPWSTSYGVNAAQPLIVDGNRFFVSAGYGHGAALVEVRDGKARTVWESTRMKNKFSSSVLHEGHVYGLDEAILACIDVATGELKWKGGRYGYGQLLLADGHLIVTTERGDVVLVKASPESHQEIARFSAIDGKTWNTPAISDGRLLVRNTREMACYRIAP